MTRTDTNDSRRNPPQQQQNRRRQVDHALDKLRQIVWQGLEHGFFECTVIVEIMQGSKRRLLIKAGNSFQYLIAADELDLDDRS